MTSSRTLHLAIVFAILVVGAAGAVFALRAEDDATVPIAPAGARAPVADGDAATGGDPTAGGDANAGARRAVAAPPTAAPALRVRVVDARGEPVPGVWMALGLDADRVHVIARAATGADGVVAWYPRQLAPRGFPRRDAERERAMNERIQAGVGRVDEFERGLRDTGRLDAAMPQRLADRRREIVQEQEDGEFYERVRLVGQVGDLAATGRLPAELANWPVVDFVLVAEVPAAQPTFLCLAAHAIPAGIVELRLPPTSALDLRVIGPDGAAPRSRCRVTARVADPGRLPDRRLRGFDGLCVAAAEAGPSQPRVRLAPVGAALTLRVRVASRDPAFDFEVDLVSGPHEGTPREVVVQAPRAAGRRPRARDRRRAERFPASSGLRTRCVRRLGGGSG